MILYLKKAERRVEELEWYFLPFQQQQESKQDFSTPTLKLLKRMKKEQLAGIYFYYLKKII